jgi:hypothetical protein
MRAARRAGAIIHGMPSIKTTVVVRGRPNPLQAAGRAGGLKLMEIKRLRKKGHRITLLSEKTFWRLVSRRPEKTTGMTRTTGMTGIAARGQWFLFPIVHVIRVIRVISRSHY